MFNLCVSGGSTSLRGRNNSQVLREEHGSSSFQRDGEEVLPLPWSLLLPMPLQGCSRDSTVSHVRSPRGFGGYPTSPRTQTLRSAAMMFHDMTFTQFPGQGHTMSSFVSISRSSLCDAPWNLGQTLACESWDFPSQGYTSPLCLREKKARNKS